MENKRQRSLLGVWVLIGGIAGFAFGTALTLIAGVSYLTLVLCGAVGALAAYAAYLEMAYPRGEIKLKENMPTLESMLLELDLMAGICRKVEASRLRHHRMKKEGLLLTVWLYEDRGVTMTFSIAVISPHAVELRAHMHEEETGKAVDRTLRLGNLDPEELDSYALQHLDDPEFVRTLTPLSREVMVRG